MAWAIEKAERAVEAIDKRIDAVRAEMYRVDGFDPETLSYDTDEERMAACSAFDAVRRRHEDYVAIETSLFLRRADAADVRDHLIAKKAKADERAEARRLTREWCEQREALRCPKCGQIAA